MSAARLARRLAEELCGNAPPSSLGEAILAFHGGDASPRTMARAIAAETVLTVLNVLSEDGEGWALVGDDGVPLDGLHEAFLEAIAHASL